MEHFSNLDSDPATKTKKIYFSKDFKINLQQMCLRKEIFLTRTKVFIKNVIDDSDKLADLQH